jgi:hypothetical protein
VKRFSTALVAATATAALMPVATSNASVNARSVLNLQLNERAGATVAADTSGERHNGAIGSHVVMTGSYADWDRHAPNEGSAYGNAHLITVADDSDGSLDPEGSDFTIEFRFRTRDSFGNIMQKGQATTAGGQVKVQIPKGKVSCMFKTPAGTSTATSGTTPLNDNAWHVIRCERTKTSVTMYVDGVRKGRNTNATGVLNNNKPWTFGGKSECNATTVSCDYFAGEIDYVRMTKG